MRARTIIEWSSASPTGPTVDDFAWAPPTWTCCGFPLEGESVERVEIAQAMEVLHRLADTITDADSTALGPAMHVAHMLVGRQGSDGLWPAALNARTGENLSAERTDAPLPLYARLNELLRSSEFDHVLEYARKQAENSTLGGQSRAVAELCTIVQADR